MLWLLPVAWSRPEGTLLVIQIRDPEGEAVPTAAVRFPVERDRHQVSELGRWSSPVLYLPDGSELFFGRDQSYELEVLAPGYRPLTAQHVVRGGRRDKLKLVLEPMDLTVPQHAPEPAQAALQTVAQWRQIALAPPHERWMRELHGARSRARQHAEAWLQWQRETGAEDPRAAEICRLAHDHPEHCEP